MTEAAQPMPERLKVRMLCLNLKWFTTAADSDGVGLKAEQFTMRPSICSAQTPSSLALVQLVAPLKAGQVSTLHCNPS